MIRNEYLVQLKQVYKFKHPSKLLQVGKVVLIGTDNSKCLQWLLAEVQALYPGKDGHTYVEKLKIKNGEFYRPIQRLYPLEIYSEQGKSYRENPNFVKTVVAEQENISKRSLSEKKCVYSIRIGRRVKRSERHVKNL